MNTPDYVAAVLAHAEAGGIHSAELAALRSRLRQLADPQAGLLPGEVLQPVADLPRLDELPEPPPGQDTRQGGGRARFQADGDCMKKVLRSQGVEQLRHRRFPTVGE